MQEGNKSNFFLQQLSLYTLALLQTFTRWSKINALFKEKTAIKTQWNFMVQMEDKLNDFTGEVVPYTNLHQPKKRRGRLHMLHIGPKQDSKIAEPAKNAAIFKPRTL